jgi:F-type H+-transporting ATPase subunit gamma
MASLDDLKKRIASVKSTQKITKAMKMVAAAKLRRAQESAEKGRPYSEKMNNVILNLSSGISDKENAPKLLSGSGSDKVHLCVVMTSDRGLCGGFNSNIIKKAKSYFAKLSEEGKELKIITVGSKGNDQLKRAYGDKIISNISFKESKHANYFDAEKVGKMVIEKFESEEFDVCTIFYNQFKNVITQIPSMASLPLRHSPTPDVDRGREQWLQSREHCHQGLTPCHPVQKLSAATQLAYERLTRACGRA